MGSVKLEAKMLHPGSAKGRLLLLDQPLSFWGGFDPDEGRVIDVHHPQAGTLVGGKILAMPGTRGSAGTPAGLAESIRLGVGPLGIVTTQLDLNIIAGVMVAEKLYRVNVPVFQVNPDGYSFLENGQRIALDEDCSIHIGPTR